MYTEPGAGGDEPLAIPPLRLNATGYSGPTGVTGRVALGPCEHVPADLVDLLARMAQVLYACSGALRSLNRPAENGRHALLQLLSASTAIAATEAETAATGHGHLVVHGPASPFASLSSAAEFYNPE